LESNRVTSPEPVSEPSYIEAILNSVAPTTAPRIPQANARRDQLFLYLEELPNGDIGIIEYWRLREA